MNLRKTVLTFFSEVNVVAMTDTYALNDLFGSGVSMRTLAWICLVLLVAYWADTTLYNGIYGAALVVVVWNVGYSIINIVR